ncbi:MAG: hypothetical protein R3C02_26300, partial [Planctomycetaceae bacterium]
MAPKRRYTKVPVALVADACFSEAFITHETDTIVLFDDDDWRKAAPMLQQIPNVVMIRFTMCDLSSESTA